MSVNVVWFKRDLRLSDNAAINDAVNRDLPIICLFNLDSQRIGRMDVSGIHIEWELDCLRSLAKDINGLGGVIKFNYGDIIDILEKLHSDYKINSIICNEETGLQWSWERDKLVAKWCETNRIDFIEHPSNGVIRKLKTRDDWKKHRDQRISSSLIPRPEKLPAPDDCQSDAIPNMEELGLTTRQLTDRPILARQQRLIPSNPSLKREVEAIEKACLVQLQER